MARALTTLRRAGLAAGIIALLVGVANAGAQPPDPAANLRPGPVPAACSTHGLAVFCQNDVITYLNRARATLGLGPYALPSTFTVMPADQQLLVLTNLDRLAYAIAPLDGLSSTLGAVALPAAVAHQDPSLPDSWWQGALTYAWSSSWAAGFDNALAAYYFWMYDDGYPGGNVDCKAPTDGGCWVHRHNTFVDDPAPADPQYAHVRAMGAAATKDPAGANAYATLLSDHVVQGAQAQPIDYTYTWSQALAAGAATNPYDPGPLVLDVAVSLRALGNGRGSITEAGGLACRTTCTSTLLSGTQAVFTPHPSPGSAFTGWSGSCHGRGPCTVLIAQPMSLGARFMLLPNARIRRATVRGRSATFVLTTTNARRLTCALTRRSSSGRAQRPRFTSCSTHPSYRHLRGGRYELLVRATGPGGVDPTPATRRFTIRSLG